MDDKPITSDILEDILVQPSLLKDALQQHLTKDSALDVAARGVMEMRPRRIVLTGMGSSLFASYGAYLHLLNVGLGAIWIPLSELLHYAAGQIGPDTLIIVVSQSGETIEALRLLADRRPNAILAVTNNAASTLAKEARWVIPSCAGPEQSVATRTYTCALLALTVLAGRIAGASPRELEGNLSPAIAAAAQVATEAPAQIAALPEFWRSDGPLTIIGRGPSLCTALSAGLLFKETAKLPVEGMSSAQFRHGPLEIAGRGHRVIICTAPGPTLALDSRLAAELRHAGSDVLVIGPGEEPAPHMLMPESAYAELYTIIPLQLLARECALQRGIMPGSFRYIGKVTTSE